VILEAELARPVVEYWRAHGVVFPEVTVWAYGRRADIVVMRDDASIDIVETKRYPNRKLIRQIEDWKPYAERCWVAYDPPRRASVAQRWRETFLRAGVGVIHVIGGQVFVSLEAIESDANPFHRSRLVRALSPLHDEYGEAGGAAGRYLTVFRVTCDNLRDAVAAAPGCTIRDAVARISHHYANERTARASLMKWVRLGKVVGVEARELQGCAAFGLYPSPSTPERT
jgi:hypothetical protein